MFVPSRSRETWLASHGARARDWLDRLPGLSADLMQRWSCVAAGPVRAGFGGVIQPVRRVDGTRAVLKMSVPYDAEDVESTILETWDGRAAVRLLERDDVNRARLLEQLEDGSLADLADAEDSMAVIGRIARRLAVPAPEGLPRLSEACAGWETDLADMNRAAGHPLPAKVVDAAVATCRELGPGQPDTLLHADLHQHNVLRGSREEWLVIDPLGAVGDLASECLTHLRDRWAGLRRHDRPEQALRRRIEVFAEAAEIDTARARRWTQTRATVTSLRNRRGHAPMADHGLHDWMATTLAMCRAPHD